MTIHDRNYSNDKILIQLFQFWLYSAGRMNKANLERQHRKYYIKIYHDEYFNKREIHERSINIC